MLRIWAKNKKNSQKPTFLFLTFLCNQYYFNIVNLVWRVFTFFFFWVTCSSVFRCHRHVPNEAQWNFKKSEIIGSFLKTTEQKSSNIKTTFRRWFNPQLFVLKPYDCMSSRNWTCFLKVESELVRLRPHRPQTSSREIHFHFLWDGRHLHTSRGSTGRWRRRCGKRSAKCWGCAYGWSCWVGQGAGRAPVWMHRGRPPPLAPLSM